MPSGYIDADSHDFRLFGYFLSELEGQGIMNRPCKVVFILSTNYAGSHLLTQLLGAHPQCRSIGELHNYRKYQDRPDDRHSVVNDFAVNPWFAGLDSLPQQQWHPQILKTIQAEQPDVCCLVDNSKKADWASKFVGHAEIDARFIHLIRDPRALVRRWEKTYDSADAKRSQRRRLVRANPRYLLKAFTGSEHEIYLYKWLQANQEITSFLARTGQSANVVTYRDLAADTEQALQRLMPQLGLDYAVSQLAFGEVEHRGTLKKEYLEQSKRSEIRLDMRWLQELPEKAQEMIAENRDVQRYLSELGLHLRPDGLSRR